MGKTRQSANLVSDNNLFVDITNDRVGVGITNPTTTLQVEGNVSIASTIGIGTIIDIIPYDTLNSGTLSFEGSAGQLFSITNNLTTGSIFSVNDVSGIPSIDVDADGTISLAAYGGNTGIGLTNPSAKLEVSGVIKDAGGNVRSLPNNAKTTSYILTADDVGELINITTGGVTVPASVFSAGNSVTIYNNSGSSQTITQGSGVTLRLAGTATTGNRTLAQRGITTITCVASDEFVISGAGLS